MFVQIGSPVIQRRIRATLFLGAGCPELRVREGGLLTSSLPSRCLDKSSTRSGGPVMVFKFNEAFEKAFESVSLRVFHDLIKTLTDGLPPDLASIDLWTTDLIGRQPSENEIIVASHLVFMIEEECRHAFVRLLFEPGFYPAFIKSWTKSQGRRMAKGKKKRQTMPFEIALKAAPKKSTKEILRAMEKSGAIEDDDEYYLIVEPDVDRTRWKKIKKTSMAPKFSRLRRGIISSRS